MKDYCNPKQSYTRASPLTVLGNNFVLVIYFTRINYITLELTLSMITDCIAVELVGIKTAYT